MAQNGSKWLEMAKSGSKWLEIAQNVLDFSNWLIEITQRIQST